MLGLIVQLAISWLIVWLIERRGLSVLGLRPTKQRLVDFLIFFFITAIFCASGILMKMYFGKQQWQLNPNLSIDLISTGIWWNVRSVLYEELIFRGVILYVLIRRIGFSKSIIVSAIAFGIYHWFSFEVLGNIMPMVMIFIITGAMGLLLAYGYSKTFSLYIPIGIHLGWNLTQIFIFSQGPIGKGVFIQINPQEFRTNSYFIFFCVTFLPMIGALLTDYLLIRQRKQTAIAILPSNNNKQKVYKLN
jgi:membrane protease YdiL (CAAX protease family)